MTQQEAGNCGNGFICEGGTMAEQPTSTQNGSLCPAGQSCSVLVQGAQDCAVGYYQPN